jgi:hypothetical protein
MTKLLALLAALIATALTAVSAFVAFKGFALVISHWEFTVAFAALLYGVSFLGIAWRHKRQALVAKGDHPRERQ